MHMLFQHYISTIINEYNIHFDSSFCKYDEIVDRKGVNFFKGGGPILPIPAVSVLMIFLRLHRYFRDPLTQSDHHF